MKRNSLISLILLAVSLASICVASFIGTMSISPAKVLYIILEALDFISPSANDSPNASASVVVLQIRLSRTALAFGIGMALALAGVIFQGILRNPLADPFTLGVSGGAAFGAALAISLGLTAALVPIAAMSGAAASLALVLFLGLAAGSGSFVQNGPGKETLVLAGVVVAAFLSALISLVKTLDEESVAGIVFWIMGSLQNRSWHDFMLFIPGFTLAILPLPFMHRALDLLSLGDTEARQLGLDAQKSRLILLLAASVLSASCVAVSGIIGFVGLIIPHFMRMLQGPAHGPLLLNSALAGGLLLLWADVLARSILPAGIELPVGVVTAMLGGPFFCFLLVHKNRKRA